MNEIEKFDSNERRLEWQWMKSLMGIIKKLMAVNEQYDGN